MLVDVLIGNKVYSREVVYHVDPMAPTICYGSVGRAEFRWEKHNFDYPRVAIPGERLGRYDLSRTKRLVKRFLEEYGKLLQFDGKSPMHFEAMTEEEKDASPSLPKQPDGHISGVPLWMKETCKVWTLCKFKDATRGIYYRRTRFDEEHKEIVSKFLPLCSKCENRESCTRPCESPETNSMIKVLTK